MHVLRVTHKQHIRGTLLAEDVLERLQLLAGIFGRAARKRLDVEIKEHALACSEVSLVWLV